MVHGRYKKRDAQPLKEPEVKRKSFVFTMYIYNSKGHFSLSGSIFPSFCVFIKQPQISAVIFLKITQRITRHPLILVHIYN